MAIVNMTQAAKLAGVGRSTIYRKAKQGIISTTKLPDGSPGVDTSELFRVFHAGTQDTVKVEHEVTQDNALLKQEIEHLKQVVTHKDQIIEVQAQALRLLEYKREGFFARMFSRGEK